MAFETELNDSLEVRLNRLETRLRDKSATKKKPLKVVKNDVETGGDTPKAKLSLTNKSADEDFDDDEEPDDTKISNHSNHKRGKLPTDTNNNSSASFSASREHHRYSVGRSPSFAELESYNQSFEANNKWASLNKLLQRAGFSTIAKESSMDDPATIGAISECFRELLSQFEHRGLVINDMIVANEGKSVKETKLNDAVRHATEQVKIANSRLLTSEDRIREIERTASESRRNANLETKRLRMEVTTLKQQLHQSEQVLHLSQKDNEILKEKLDREVEKRTSTRQRGKEEFQKIHGRRIQGDARAGKSLTDDLHTLDAISDLEAQRDDLEEDLKAVKAENRRLVSVLREYQKSGNGMEMDERTRLELASRPTVAEYAESQERIRLLQRKLDSALTEMNELQQRYITHLSGISKQPTMSVNDRFQQAFQAKQMNEARGKIHRTIMHEDKQENDIRLRMEAWGKRSSSSSSAAAEETETVLYKNISEKVEAVSLDMLKGIVREACLELGISDPKAIPTELTKYGLISAAMPKLQSFLKEIANFVLSSAPGEPVDGIEADKDLPPSVLRKIVPKLQEWSRKIMKYDEIVTFRSSLLQILDPVLNSQVESRTAKDLEILKCCYDLVADRISTETKLSTMVQDLGKSRDLPVRIISHMMQLFDISTADKILPKMNEIYRNLAELKNFAKSLRTLLGLPIKSSLHQLYERIQRAAEREDIS
jgi:hypothetical protein